MTSPPTEPRRSELIRRAVRLAGPRTLFWLGVVVFASLLLSLVEISIAAIIQLLLRTLGLLAAGTKGFSFVERWEPSAFNLAIILLVVGAVRSAAQFLAMQGSSTAMEMLNARLKLLTIYSALQSEQVRPISAAAISYQLSELFPKAAFFTFYLSQVVSLGLQSLVLAILMLVTAWRESAVGLVGLGLIGLLVLSVAKRVRLTAALVPAEQRQLTAGIERVARNWLLVQALRTKRREYDGLLENVLRYSSHVLRTGLLSNSAAAGTPFSGILLIIALILLGRSVFGTPGLAIVSCLYLLVRFTQNLQSTATNLGFVNSYLPQFLTVLDDFDRISPLEVERAVAPASLVSMGGYRARDLVDAVPVAASDASVVLPPPRIEVAGLSYTYEGQTRAAVAGLSFSVAPGAQCGLIGPSGSGKSTILAVILGILEPQQGTVLLDGKSPREVFQGDELRIGYVGPDPFIIEGSIRDNMDYGRRCLVGESDYWTALRSADLESVVRLLPAGLGHRLSPQADGLSAGQKQRLALARALLNQPQFLILDEPSANLDDESELQITASIERLKGKTTVLVVSHRRGMLRFADTIVDLGEAAPASSNAPPASITG